MTMLNPGAAVNGGAGVPAPPAAAERVPGTPRVARPRPLRLVPLPVGWPLVGLITLFPLWWALGLGVLIFPIMAVFMAAELLRRRPLRVPRGFGLWLLFMLAVLASHLALGMNPDGTVPQTVRARLLGVEWRIVGYLTVTIIALYAYNLTRKELPQRRLIKLLAWLFAVTVAGGLLGTFAGRFAFTSPVELLLPAHVRANSFVQALVHPAAAQLQQTLGYALPRPAAPWGYTNTWGNMYVVLVVWFFVWAFMVNRNRLVKAGSIALLALSVVPVVYSLNRGLWVALGVLVAYLGVRLAVRGKMWIIGAVAGLAVVLLVALAVTPLGTVINSRFQHGQSNDQRAYTTIGVLTGMKESPIVGYGGTRQTLGSEQSIAVGKSTSCPECGNHTLGANGQLWNVLYLNGILGLSLYLAFMIGVLWRYRRDNSAIGLAGSATIVSMLICMFFYNQLIAPLAISMLACVLMWRNHPGHPGAPVEPEAAPPDRELPRVPSPRAVEQ